MDFLFPDAKKRGYAHKVSILGYASFPASDGVLYHLAHHGILEYFRPDVISLKLSSSGILYSRASSTYMDHQLRENASDSQDAYRGHHYKRFWSLVFREKTIAPRTHRVWILSCGHARGVFPSGRVVLVKCFSMIRLLGIKITSDFTRSNRSQ